MIETYMNVLLVSTVGYLLVGLVFAVFFVIFGVKKMDPAAEKGSFGFRLLIVPGSMLFWPLLLRRWITGAKTPEEFSCHRGNAAKH